MQAPTPTVTLAEGKTIFTCFVPWEIFHAFRKILSLSNSLDPDEAPCFVRPDLVPNCLQKISAVKSQDAAHTKFAFDLGNLAHI